MKHSYKLVEVEGKIYIARHPEAEPATAFNLKPLVEVTQDAVDLVAKLVGSK